MAKKNKIIKTVGPCKWCGHNELYNGICFMCGKLTYIPLSKRNDNAK